MKSESMTDAKTTDEQILLMCPPEDYVIPALDGEEEYANDFAIRGYEEFRKNPKKFRKDAAQQWHNLRRVFNDLGVKIVEIPPKKNFPALVFTADPSLSFHDGTGKLVTLFSRFSNEERQIEVAAHSAFFENEGTERLFVSSPYRTEGTGDNIYDPARDMFWSGYTQTTGRRNAAAGRSDQRAHSSLQHITGIEVVSLAVKRPFFHIDTSLGVLSRGHLVVYKEGMQPLAYQRMLANAFDRFGLKRDEFLIEVSNEDAARYACNLRCIGDIVVMPEVSYELQDRIRSKGYRVITTNLSHFIFSGGAVHCMTNNINEHRVPGGIFTPDITTL